MSEIALAVRVLVALVFLTAAFGKLRHPVELQGVVANYRLLPEWAVPLFTLSLPPIEAIVAVALLFDTTRWPEICAALLLTLFAFAMGINLRRGRRLIDCGCFQAALRQTLSWTLVARNLGLAVLLAIPVAVPPAVSSPAGAAQALLTGTVSFLLLQSLNVLWSTVPAWPRRSAITTGAEK